MSNYQSNLDLDQAAKLLNDEQGPIAVLTHAKPDGDAAGSVVSLVTALRAAGKDATGLLVPPILPPLENLAHASGIRIVENASDLGPFSRIVIVDTGAWSQVGPLRTLIEPMLDRTLILDHHIAGDIDAKHLFVDPTAAAAAEIIADLIEKVIDVSALDSVTCQIISEALFTGIASDTGWFKFSNTTPRTHRLAAKLISRGVNHASLYGKLEQSERPEKLALLIRAVGSLQLLADGHAAVMTLRTKDFKETGARTEETERLIDIPQAVESIQAIALITEVQTDEGVQTRISFRSKPGDNAINVSNLAGLFGGGGHARAAGAKIDAPVDDVLPLVIERITQAVTVQIDP